MSRYGRTMADAYKEVIKYSEEPEVVEAETVAETEPEEVEDLNEVAPPGWAGTVKAMKKHKDIDNPYALSWHMKKKGYKSHKKEEVEIDELTADQKKKREASRQRTHGGDEYKKMAHTADRSQKKPDRNVRKYWEKPSSMRAGPKGKLPEDIQMDDLANYDHHDYGFDTRADMVAYVEGSLSATQKAAREKSRGRFGIGNRKHNNSPQAAHSLGFGTGGDHQNRGVKKVRGAKPQGAYARTREEVEMEGNVKSKGDKPRQLKDPKKEKMVGTKSGTKVVDRDDPRYAKHPEHEALDLKKIRAQRRAKGLKNLKKMGNLMRTLDKQQSATDGHGGYAPDDGRPAHPSPKGIGGDGPPGRPRGAKYKIHTKRIAKRYKDKAAGKDKKSSSVSDAERVRASNALLSKLNTKKESVDERVAPNFVVRGGQKVKKFTTDKPGHKLVREPGASSTSKPKEVRVTAGEKAKRKIGMRKRVTKMKSKVGTALRKRNISNRKRQSMNISRPSVSNEEMQFKVKIRDLPPFYVPGKSAGAVKQALRKQLRKPDDIESIDRHTTASKKKDFRLRAQGKEE